MGTFKPALNRASLKVLTLVTKEEYERALNSLIIIRL
jgi:hypothetical protein